MLQNRSSIFAAPLVYLVFFISAGVACQAQSSAACQSYSSYKIIALPFRPARINSSGLIAGSTEDHQPVIWSEKDGLREIELPDAFTSAEPQSINEHGAIVGEATAKSSGLPSAFRYADGKFSIISPDHSKAASINDSGDIAGEDSYRLFLWHGAKMLPLGDCCGGAIHAINNSGRIVGQINDKQGHYSAFLWDSVHAFKSLAPNKASNSTAVSINNAGHILVQTFVPNQVYLLTNNKTLLVKLSPELASQPLALNNCDEVVGEFGAASDFNHAFLWTQKQGFRDLNRFIDSDAEWNLESAVDINDRGEIIGFGDHANQQDVGFLLVPDASPAKPGLPRKPR